jgi:uncharacterized MAPEG superfamily protein
MTFAYWCVLVAALMPFAWTVSAKGGGRFRNRDNHNPREFLEKLSGWQKRAHWAQLNSFEAFPAFAAAVIIAHIAGAEQGTVNALAAVFILARIAYGLLYITDHARLRSVAWFVGIGCVVGLFIAAA